MSPLVQSAQGKRARGQRPVSDAMDRAILRRYTDQPERLPLPLRREIEARLHGESIALYALADLSPSLQLTRCWIAVSAKNVAVAREQSAEGVSAVRVVPRSAIGAVVATPGLSCHRLSVLGAPDEPALAELRYTQRQRKAMELVRFELEQGLEGGASLPTDPDEAYASSVARPIRDAQALVASRESAVLWRLLGYLRPYRTRVMLGMLAAMGITLFGLVPPFVSGQLIDRVITPAQAGQLPLEQASSIAWLAVSALAAVYALRQLCNWVRLRMMNVLGEYVARDLRDELYTHMQTLSLSFFSRKKTGSLITRVSSDTDRLWEFLAFGIVDVSLAGVTLVGLGAVLLYLDWKLGLVMTVPVPLLCWWIDRHREHMSRLFLRAWRKWSAVTDVLSDTIPGIRVVKAFGREGREVARFGRHNWAVTDDFNELHAIWTRFWPAMMLSVHALILTVWCLAVPRLLSSDPANALSAGTFVSFLLYMTMFVQPIEVIGMVTRVMNRALTSAHRVFEVLDTQSEVPEPTHPVVLRPMRGDVRFERVSFSYDGVRQVLKDVSFHVRPGEMVGLVGPSGGGKSTVASLLARFYDANTGRICIDGVDVRELEAQSFRSQLGIVLQEPYLFFGSVLENIRYGLEGASVDQVVEAARAANAHDFICKLRHGYDSLVGERGLTLSGGERQRISIARALLRDPRILILDEATSSVDTETEWRIQEALERLVRGRTVLAIAHRLSTLRRADRLLVIEDGIIAEQGTGDELLAIPDGIYARLHGMQMRMQLGDGSGSAHA